MGLVVGVIVIASIAPACVGLVVGVACTVGGGFGRELAKTLQAIQENSSPPTIARTIQRRRRFFGGCGGGIIGGCCQGC